MGTLDKFYQLLTLGERATTSACIIAAPASCHDNPPQLCDSQSVSYEYDFPRYKKRLQNATKIQNDLNQ